MKIMEYKITVSDFKQARGLLYYLSLMDRNVFQDVLAQYVWYSNKEINKTEKDFCKFPSLDCTMCPICNECPLALDDEDGDLFWE